jgi:hypothetical protein
MKRHAFHSLAVLATSLLIALAAPDAAASSVLPLNLNQIIAGAQHIAHVRCIGNDVAPDATVGVVTVSTFVVLDRARGAGGATFVVRQPGGERQGLVVDYHVPKFRIGDEYVLFVPAASRLGLASPVGFAQGTFAVVPGPAGKTVGNGRDFDELLVGVSQAMVPAGIASRLALPPAQRMRMDLADFMTLVRAGAAKQ